MELETLISKGLQQPPTAIKYEVSKHLAALRPATFVLETTTGAFDLEQFHRDGHCTLEVSANIHAEIETAWWGRDYDLRCTIEQGLAAVRWQGRALEVLLMQWPNGEYGNAAARWIVAESQNVAEEFLKAVCTWCTEVRGEILVYTGGCWRKSEHLFQAISSARLSNLVLAGHLKQDIVEDVERFYASQLLYEKHGVPWKRGVLFLGPPGNGKTHAVKAMVNHLSRPCLYVRSFKAQHTSEHGNIQAVFSHARDTPSCILVLEDLDALVTDENRSYFLNELDGFAANTGIVVLATTNHPERLDPALLDRPSRFDRKYHFELPGNGERATYITMWNESLDSDMRATDAGLTAAVRATDGFSFAYLKELFLSAIMSWINTARAGDMDEVLQSQAKLLRAQMSSMNDSTERIEPAVEPAPYFGEDPDGE